MVQRFFPSARLLFVFGAVLLPGCGDVSSRYCEISGTVTFQGAEVADGTIQFFIPGAKPTLCAGAMIRDGAYQLPPEHGLKPGTYLVRISAPERLPTPTSKSQDDMMAAPFLSQERIPARFNTASTLTIEVNAGDTREYDFDLK